MPPRAIQIAKPPGPSALASSRRPRALARFTPERLALTVFTLAVVALIAAQLVEVVLRSFQRLLTPPG